MATKLIRSFLSTRPDLEIPPPLKDKLDMKRFSRKVYKMFIDYFVSIGEVDLADEVIREAKIKKAKEEIKKEFMKIPEDQRDEPIELLEDLVDTLNSATATASEVASADASATPSAPDSSEASSDPVQELVAEILNSSTTIPVVDSVVVPVPEPAPVPVPDSIHIIKMENFEKKLTQNDEVLKKTLEKLAHLETVLEFMYAKELKKTDARSTVNPTNLAGLTPAEKWKLKSKIKK